MWFVEESGESERNVYKCGKMRLLGFQWFFDKITAKLIAAMLIDRFNKCVKTW